MLIKQVRSVIEDLLRTVKKDFRQILKTVYTVENRMLRCRRLSNVYFHYGELEFYVGDDYRVVRDRRNRRYRLKKFHVAPLEQVVTFDVLIKVSLMRHNPTDLTLKVEKGFTDLFKYSHVLLDFDDCLHMENRNDHDKILEVVRSRIDEIQVKAVARHVASAIRRNF